MRRIGFDSAHAALVENPGGVREDPHPEDQVVGDDRHHHIELELSRFACQGHRGIETQHLITDLVDHLGNGRIYLAWHDARSGLYRRKQQLG